MLCPWVTPPWSSPVACVSSSHLCFLYDCLCLSLGRWSCFLCHREHGGPVLFTPSALHAHTHASSLSSPPFFLACRGRVPSSQQDAYLCWGSCAVFLSLQDITPAFLLIYSSTSTFCILYFSFIFLKLSS